MRKAGLKKSSRRKGTAANGGGNAPSSAKDAVSTGSSSEGTSSGGSERRKATSDEAALTAKNYRLAKELSDLRVRHRDETKTVTRLTMENMNLASRCREAISHVAMLKRELAMHQRRHAETLAMQRTQNQRMASTISDPGIAPGHASELTASSTSVAVAMEMDRILSAPPPPPPPPKQPHQQSAPQDQQIAMAGISAAGQEKESFPNFSSGNVRGGDGKERAGVEPLGTPGILRDLSPSSSLASQRQIPPPPDANGEGSPKYDQIPRQMGLTRMPGRQHSVSRLKTQHINNLLDDVPADEMMHDKSGGKFNSTDLFPSSPLGSTPEKGSVENFPSVTAGRDPNGNPRLPAGTASTAEMRDPLARPRSPVFRNPAVPAHTRNSMAQGGNSIDAFEASFNATFPASFSTPAEEPPPSLDIAFDVPEFHDPFFLGSLDGGGPSDAAFPEPNGHTSNGDRRVNNARGPETANRIGVDSLNSSSESRLSSPYVASPLPPPPPPPGPPPAQQRSINNTLDNFTDPSAAQDLFPESAMSTFEQISHQSDVRTPEKSASGRPNHNELKGEEVYRTPPSNFPTSESDQHSGPAVVVSPQRPEKTGASAARARYDAALNDKSNVSGSSSGGSSSKKDHQQRQPKQLKGKGADGKSASSSDVDHSPSQVLKRLHQRRAKEKSKPSTPNDPATSPPDKGSSGGRTVGARTAKSHLGKDSPNAVQAGMEETPAGSEGLPSDEEERVDVGDATAEVNPKNRKGLQSKSGRNFSNQPAESAPPMFHTTHPGRGKVANSLTGMTLSPDSMSAEIRNLDAIATASVNQPALPASVNQPALPASSSTASPVSSSLAPVGKRRNVKQPVSYAEPSLNSKLRRGDVFFPKINVRTDAGPSDAPTPVVSPSSSSSPGTDPNPDISSAENLRSANPDEVLRDLAAPAPVRQTAS